MLLLVASFFACAIYVAAVAAATLMVLTRLQ